MTDKLNSNSILFPIAVSKAVNAKDLKVATEQLEEGGYNVSFVARIQGGIKRGAPFKTKVAASANPWKLLALAMGKLNANSRRKLVQESLAMDEASVNTLKAAVTADIKEIIAATEVDSLGRITAALTLEVL